MYREALLKLGVGKPQIQFCNFELPENFVNTNWNETQKQLGELVGVQKAQISKIENSVKNARFKTIL